MGDEIYQAISKAITEGEEEEAVRRVQEALKSGSPPVEIMQRGIVAGISKAGELWKANEFFLPDVIMAADAFKAAMAILKPRLKEGEGEIGRAHV